MTLLSQERPSTGKTLEQAEFFCKLQIIRRPLEIGDHFAMNPGLTLGTFHQHLTDLRFRVRYDRPRLHRPRFTLPPHPQNCSQSFSTHPSYSSRTSTSASLGMPLDETLLKAR